MTRMPWFRFYDEMLDDLKVINMTDSCVRVFVSLLCIGNRGKTRGKIPSDVSALSRLIRMHPNKLRAALKYLEINKIIHSDGSDIVFTNWCKRQFESDSSTERTRVWRERHKNVTVTNPVTPPDTDTDTDTEKIKELHPPTRIILQDKTFFTITNEYQEELQTRFPMLNLNQELGDIATWNLLNEKKRKTAKGIKRHIDTWLKGNRDRLQAHKTENTQPQARHYKWPSCPMCGRSQSTLKYNPKLLGCNICKPEAYEEEEE